MVNLDARDVLDLAQFGLVLKLPWTKLVTFELAEDLTRAMFEGTAAQVAARPVADFEAERNICLMETLQVQNGITRRPDLRLFRPGVRGQQHNNRIARAERNRLVCPPVARKRGRRR